MSEQWKRIFSAAWSEWRRVEAGPFARRVQALNSLRTVREMARADGVDEKTALRMETFVDRALTELSAWQAEPRPQARRP